MSKWDNIYRKSIAVVIVVYNDYHALVDLVLSLSSQVESIVIIDNSDDAGEMPETVLELPAVVYRRQPTNEGLGAGLNTGITVAIEGGAQWVLLLDQDSTVSDNMVDSMLSSYRKCSDASAVAMLCPDVFLQEKGRRQHPLSFASFPPVKVTATSDAAVSNGRIIDMQEKTVKYRQHASNVIGGKASLFARFTKASYTGGIYLKEYLVITRRQAEALLEADKVTGENKVIVEEFVEMFKLGWFERRFITLRNKYFRSLLSR